MSTTIVFALSVDFFVNGQICTKQILLKNNIKHSTNFRGGFHGYSKTNLWFLNLQLFYILKPLAINSVNPPPLKNVLFFCTNLYNFNTDKTHTWKIERVLSFSAHSSLSCGDRCAIALTKLSFTCFVSFENIETVVNTKYVIL